jgi:asparagine synthetase B (glutamine-hydrolysing)
MLDTQPAPDRPAVKTRLFVVGWTRDPAKWLPKLTALARAYGLDCWQWDYGREGVLFWINSHPDVAQTGETILVKLGFARSAAREPLAARDLLGRGHVTPRGVDGRAIHGNALLLCLSRRAPVFCAYQNIASISQLFYWRTDETLLCTDTLRLLAALVEPLELNPNAVPQHLLYRTVPGEMTYFKGVSKLLCGQLARFVEGEWRLEQVERLDDLVPEDQISTITPEAISDFERKAEQLVGVYVGEIGGSGQRLGILLSGGVDSTLIASLIKSNLAPGAPLQSISYAMRVPSFEEEIRYRQHAVDLLQASHRTYNVLPADYPRLLEQAIDLLAQPVDNEQDPCYVLLAQALDGQNIRYLFSGSDPDCLFGRGAAKRLLQLETLQHIPGAGFALDLSSRLLARVWPNKAYGMKETSRLLSEFRDPLSPNFPLNLRGMMTDLDVVLKCFDRYAIRDVMEYRLQAFEAYTSSTSLAERVHLNGYTHDVHDEENAIVQFFRAYGLELVDPYLDSDFIQWSFAFEPRIRYYAQGRTKWLPKQLLDNRLRSPTTGWPKLSGGFDHELFEWMKQGVLREVVNSIERPAFMSAADFDRKRDQPDWFTWNLLTLDLFQKRILNGAGVRPRQAA